tara:strand:+ start:935 stop:1279 length:345 start_codon:yes stop_codon:yes gene_type:complete
MDYIERKELGMGKSMTRLWLRAKNRDLMEIANALRPSDNDVDSHEMDIFLDLMSIYGAMDACIDMVEEVEPMIWDAQAKNASLRLTIQQLQRKVKLYEDQFDILDINLTQIEND